MQNSDCSPDSQLINHFIYTKLIYLHLLLPLLSMFWQKRPCWIFIKFRDAKWIVWVLLIIPVWLINQVQLVFPPKHSVNQTLTASKEGKWICPLLVNNYFFFLATLHQKSSVSLQSVIPSPPLQSRWGRGAELSILPDCFLPKLVFISARLPPSQTW